MARYKHIDSKRAQDHGDTGARVVLVSDVDTHRPVKMLAVKGRSSVHC